MITSWIESANVRGCNFPLENLPFGVFRHGAGAPRCGVAIGDRILDLGGLQQAGLLAIEDRAFEAGRLNEFMALGPAAWNRVREVLTALLAETGPSRLRDDAELRRRIIAPMEEVRMQLPFAVAGYTDFYSSRHHALNVSRLLRGADATLAPNWLHMPIGYNGRASTVVVSGTGVTRPLGQSSPQDGGGPHFGPSRKLDFELELGTVVGLPSVMGRPLSVMEADDLIFGYVLLNDWSARDLQAWEYQPLGPFQSKAFATSISPWVVTKAALEPFRTSTPDRERPLLPYLVEPRPLHYNIELEVLLRPAGEDAVTTITRSNFRTNYYSPAQQIAHHAIGGCRMQTGDLLGSGTVSGIETGQFGSMLETSLGGREPLSLVGGQVRSFLEDGDTVLMEAWADGPDYRIGFGTCEGEILPAPALGCDRYACAKLQ